MYLYNGRRTPATDLDIRVLGRGFLYGDGVFETMRSHNYVLFRWEDHWRRLGAGLKLFKIKYLHKSDAVRKRIEKNLREQCISDAYVRLNVWRKDPMSFPPGAESASHELVIIGKHEPRPAKFYREGIRCCVSKRVTRNEHSALFAVKSLNYGEAIVARLEAQEAGCDDAILLDTAGNVAEATTSNIFIVKNGAIVTPSLASGILPGITRQAVIEICAANGIPLRERTVRPGELKTADEIFLTNTTAGIFPVREVKGIFRNKNFRITNVISEKYRKLS